jgi:hypothetical protein
MQGRQPPPPFADLRFASRSQPGHSDQRADDIGPTRRNLPDETVLVRNHHPPPVLRAHLDHDGASIGRASGVPCAAEGHTIGAAELQGNRPLKIGPADPAPPQNARPDRGRNGRGFAVGYRRGEDEPATNRLSGERQRKVSGSPCSYCADTMPRSVSAGIRSPSSSRSTLKLFAPPTSSTYFSSAGELLFSR